MSVDPRAVANALLEKADERNVPFSNAALNKVIFFAHADHLLLNAKPLINMTFEAWEFGPVVPMIYRQFRKYGSKPIRKLATYICSKTGEDIEFDYRSSRIDISYINQVLDRYGHMSVSALIALSHVRDGPWDRVWNGPRQNRYGMTISDELIVTCHLPDGTHSGKGSYVH